MTALLQQIGHELSLLELLRNYTGFLSYFAIYGGLAFQLLVARRAERRLLTGKASDPPLFRILRQSAQRTALVGATGAAWLVVLLMLDTADVASERGLGFTAALGHQGGRMIAQYVFAGVLLSSFVLARSGNDAGWKIAAAGAIGLVFRNIFTGRWFAVVTPFHEVMASLWLATLAVMLFAGIGPVLRSELPGERKSSVVAELVASFSPVALTAAALLESPE